MAVLADVGGSDDRVYRLLGHDETVPPAQDVCDALLSISNVRAADAHLAGMHNEQIEVSLRTDLPVERVRSFLSEWLIANGHLPGIVEVSEAEHVDGDGAGTAPSDADHVAVFG